MSILSLVKKYPLVKKCVLPVYRLSMKLFIRCHEHVYTSPEGKKVRYMAVRRKNSDKMIVFFSGFAAGKMPRYNYIRWSLSHTDCNLMFILDDFINKPGCGSYYLGAEGDWYAPPLIRHVIDARRRKWNIRTLITAGTSKGGTAALMQGILLPADYVIIGACQYHIGTYMKSSTICLPELLGDSRTVEELDEYMPRLLADHGTDAVKPRLLLHYSDQEHTWEDNMRDLRQALIAYGYPILEEDVADYTVHECVGSYYPPFLLRMLKKIGTGAFEE